MRGGARFEHDSRCCTVTKCCITEPVTEWTLMKFVVIVEAQMLLKRYQTSRYSFARASRLGRTFFSPSQTNGLKVKNFSRLTIINALRLCGKSINFSTWNP
jgi:hypothetical protein